MENKELLNEELDLDAAEEVITLEIPETSAGIRLDKILGEALPDFTRSALQKLMEQGNVTKNGKALAKNYKPSKGDVITVIIPPPEVMDTLPEDIPLEIIYFVLMVIINTENIFKGLKAFVSGRR